MAAIESVGPFKTDTRLFAQEPVRAISHWAFSWPLSFMLRMAKERHIYNYVSRQGPDPRPTRQSLGVGRLARIGRNGVAGWNFALRWGLVFPNYTLCVLGMEKLSI